MNKYSAEEVLANIQKASGYYQQIMKILMQRKTPEIAMSILKNEQNATIAKHIYSQFNKHPEKFAKLNLDYANRLQRIIIDAMGKFSGHEFEESEEKTKKDRRFEDPAWQQNVYFDFVKQFYLLNSDWVQNHIEELELDCDDKNYLEFITKQFIDAMSPSNFMFSNPEVIRESIDSGMQNIAEGMQNFLRDIENSDGIINISTIDKKKFRVGKNLATTKGKVIYQNDIMQLICYEPMKKTHAIPLLVIPPWINKYYILDLSEKNSMVKWLVENNYQVFLISWVNPGKEHKEKDFENYLQEGLLDAYVELKKIGIDKVNAVGYCIGGTLLAGALSYLKQTKNEFVNSATFLTTLIDFTHPGDIGAFINESTLDVIKQEVCEKGYLDGQFISNSFGLIRANDLVWNFFVNNYLLGKAPAAFDILYWNADSTNLPASMYLYYLKNMYINNLMIKPGGLTWLGKPIDVSKINIPTFSLAGKSDHIALWNGVYEGYKLLGGDKTFCLTDAGHVAGVVNPADNKKYAHHIGCKIKKTAADWLACSELKDGSWWNSWNKWLSKQSGVISDSLDYKKLKSIEAAPGSYVMK